MKKSIIIAIAAAVSVPFLFSSCAKEVNDTNEIIPEIVTESLQTVNAVYVDDDTKTAYDEYGTFSWVDGDKITMVVYNDGSVEPAKRGNVDRYPYATSAVDGRYATFSGSTISSPWVEAGLALYPNNNVSTYNCLAEAGTYDIDLDQEHFQVKLNQEIRPNLASPLAVVPLIGRKDGAGQYQFQTATGILKVTINNIPSSARYVVLRSNSDYRMSGTFSLDSGDCEIKESNYVSDGYYQKTVYFVPEADGETRTFYFPLPTGTIPAGMTLFMDTIASERLMTKTTKKAITITANHITPLAAVTSPYYANLALTGTADSFSAYVDSKSPAVVKVKVAAASTADAAVTAAGSSDKVITALGIGNAVSVSGSLSTTGLNYVGYKAYNSLDEEVGSGSIPAYFISSSDASARMGTYQKAWANGMYPSTLSDNGDDTITFEVSDNPAKGNVMITQAFGFCNDVSLSTHTSIYAYNFATFSDGNPIYGCYTPANSNPKLIFSNISDQVFYYDGSGHPHFICEYGSDTLRFGFDSNAYNSTTYDLLCWGAYLMNCYDNTSSYDMYINKFAANKQ